MTSTRNDNSKDENFQIDIRTICYQLLLCQERCRKVELLVVIPAILRVLCCIAISASALH